MKNHQKIFHHWKNQLLKRKTRTSKIYIQVLVVWKLLHYFDQKYKFYIFRLKDKKSSEEEQKINLEFFNYYHHKKLFTLGRYRRILYFWMNNEKPKIYKLDIKIKE